MSCTSSLFVSKALNKYYKLTLLPRQGLVEKFKHDKEKAPDVVAAAQLLLLMCIDAGIRNRTSKVRDARGMNGRIRFEIQMFLGKTEVNKIDLASVLPRFPHHEI